MGFVSARSRREVVVAPTVLDVLVAVGVIVVGAIAKEPIVVAVIAAAVIAVGVTVVGAVAVVVE